MDSVGFEIFFTLEEVEGLGGKGDGVIVRGFWGGRDLVDLDLSVEGC